MVSIDPWSSAFGALVVLVAGTSAIDAARRRFRGWSWWQSIAFLAGTVTAAGAVLSPLDRLGEDGFLTAHVAQHLLLADVAAPLLLLGLPPRPRRFLRDGLARAAAGRSLSARGLTAAVSPVGAVVLWAAATYVWLLPPLHRLAVPDGFAHLLDHLSFLGFGLLIWLGAFDPRPSRDWRSGLRAGGLPWWARHVYAMSTRVAMFPPAFAIWLAGESAYHRPGATLPEGISIRGDLERAASVMIGFEMLLGGFAVVLAFVFVSVHEGRGRRKEGSV